MGGNYLALAITQAGLGARPVGFEVEAGTSS
jgi:hypothetical protein